MVKIGLRFVQRALFDFHVRFCLVKACHCLVQIGLGRGFSGEEFLCARGIYFGKLQRGLCVGQIAFCLSDCCLKKHRINLRDYLAGFYLGIKIDKQFCDVPRDLAAHLHVDDGIQRAGRGNRLRNRAARNGGDLIILSAPVAALPHHGSDNQQPNDQSDPRDKSFHLCGS